MRYIKVDLTENYELYKNELLFSQFFFNNFLFKVVAVVVVGSNKICAIISTFDDCLSTAIVAVL